MSIMQNSFAEFDLVIASLILMNVFQLWFWSRQTQRLIDKNMSKNYPEYVQTESFRAQLPLEHTSTDQADDLITDDEVLKELNGKFGF